MEMQNDVKPSTPSYDASTNVNYFLLQRSSSCLVHQLQNDRLTNEVHAFYIQNHENHRFRSAGTINPSLCFLTL